MKAYRAAIEEYLAPSWEDQKSKAAELEALQRALEAEAASCAHCPRLG